MIAGNSVTLRVCTSNYNHDYREIEKIFIRTLLEKVGNYLYTFECEQICLQLQQGLRDILCKQMI